MRGLWGGLDLGLGAAAWALVEGGSSPPWRLVQVSICAFPSAASVGERLVAYADWFRRQLNEVDTQLVQAVCAEAPFVGKNVRSALLLGTLQGVSWTILRMQGWPPLEMIPPARLKKALTGRGHASKAQVAQWLPHHLHQPFTLPENPHATDAIGIAIARALLQNSPITRRFTSRADR